MAKRFDMVDDSLEDKLRIGETVLWIYGCLLVLAGLGFVIAKCTVAEFGAAFVGLVATISGAGLVALCWLMFRMIRKVSVDAAHMQRLKQRVDELELEFEVNLTGVTIEAPPAPPTPLAPVQSKVPTAPVSEANNKILFAKAIETRDLETCRQLWPLMKESLDPDRAEHAQAEVTALEKQTSKTLRCNFAEQFRAEQYEAALETGEYILRLFPDSQMSTDFQAIREKIENKARPLTSGNNNSSKSAGAPPLPGVGD